MNENNIIGVILAGGKSRRFGSDKSAVQLGSKTLIEHALSKIEKDFSEILIVDKKKNKILSKKNIFVIEDCIKGHLGPLIGVLSAMKWVKKKKKNYSWIATFPCDTPFFGKKIIIELKKASKKSQINYFFLKVMKKDTIFLAYGL